MATMVARFSGGTPDSIVLHQARGRLVGGGVAPAQHLVDRPQARLGVSDSAAMRTNMCTSESAWPNAAADSLFGGLRGQRGNQQGGDDQRADEFHGGATSSSGSKHSAACRFPPTQ